MDRNRNCRNLQEDCCVAKVFVRLLAGRLGIVAEAWKPRRSGAKGDVQNSGLC